MFHTAAVESLETPSGKSPYDGPASLWFYIKPVWKFLHKPNHNKMAAEIDLSLPTDSCSKGFCDLMSERSKTCGIVEGMTSFFSSTRRTDRSDVL